MSPKEMIPKSRFVSGYSSFSQLASRSAIHLKHLGLFSLFAVLGYGPAEAAVGDRVRTVSLPPEVECRVEGVADHVAISVAVVPTTAVAPTTIPTDRPALLATSCRTAQGSTIYFIDPGPADRSVSEFPGAVIDTVETRIAGTAFSPANGWGSFAFRGDVSPQDMLACSNPASDAEPHRIYAINLQTGEARLLFAAAMPTPGKPYCDGLAWDSLNDTIFMSPDVSNTVYHYGPTGDLIKTLPVPAGCFVQDVSGNSGIAVVGPNLLLACNGEVSIFEVRQSDGAVARSFPSGAERAEDLECDRTTFPDVSVAWTKDAFIGRFIALETPVGSCGLCQADQRRDLNSLDPNQQRELAALLEEYLTGEIVGVHRRNIAPWHGPGNLFFPGHRGYVGGFETWLLNVRGRPEFVPLPKWHPANPIPPEFRRTDMVACRSSGASALSDCSGITNFNINRPLPADFVVSGLPPTDRGLCAFRDLIQLQGSPRVPALEGLYHNAVHCDVDGTMCDVAVSPSALVFMPWHAFVDDVARQFESTCRMRAPACTDVFAPLTTSRFAAFGASDESPRGPAHLAAPIGFWWWFEDLVTPPELSPSVVVDHSGFNFVGRVRGGAKLVPGLVGQALQLDGRNDYVVVRDLSVGEVGTSDFTLDAWVKTAAGGIQPIIDKRNLRGVGYALFLEDGLLGLRLGTDRIQEVFMAETRPIADGQWHHVAAVVSRQRPEEQDGDEEDVGASALFVDGEVVLEFDATTLDDDATSRRGLRIGRARFPHGSAFFEGELDEIDLFRSALSRDLVASIYIAGSAGKYGSLGGLPTSAGRPPCLVELGEMIAEVPEAAPLAPLYDQVIEALREGREALARRRLRELRELAMEMAGELMTFLNAPLHVIHAQADACFRQRDLQAAAGRSINPANGSPGEQIP